MDRWQGRVALVTGASEGVGLALSQALLRHGMTVIGCARNLEKLQDASSKMDQSRGKFHAVQCDVGCEEDIVRLFEVVKEHGGLDVMINNAAMCPSSTVLQGDPGQWLQMCQVNIVGPASCCQKAVNSMKAKGATDGVIININSEHGQAVPAHVPQLHFYAITKHGLRAVKQALRQELQDCKSSIRVAEVALGLTQTPGVEKALGKEFAGQMMSSMKVIQPEEAADCIIQIIAAPPHVELYDLTIGNMFNAA